MIYARSIGESFGLSCGEFAYLNKLIISYKFNRHRAHLDHLYNRNYISSSNRREVKRNTASMPKGTYVVEIKFKYGQSIFKKMILN